MYNSSPEAKAIIVTSNLSEEERTESIRNISKTFLNGLTPENILPLWGNLSKLFLSLNSPDKKPKKPMINKKPEKPLIGIVSPQGVIELHLVDIGNIITTTNTKKNKEIMWIEQVVEITCLSNPQQKISIPFQIPPVPIMRPIKEEEKVFRDKIEPLLLPLINSYIQALQELQMPLEIKVDRLIINGLESSLTLAVPWLTLKEIINSQQHFPNSKQCFFPYSLDSPYISLSFRRILNEKDEKQQSFPLDLGEFIKFAEMLLRKRFVADLNGVFNEIQKIVGEYLRIADLPKDQLPQFASELYLAYLRWIYQLMKVYLKEVISPLDDFLKRRNPVEILWQNHR